MSASETVFIGSDGQREYPCRCGETHRGPYAAYDYGHHNCFHASPLQRVQCDWTDFLICGDCGQTFHVEPTSTTTNAKRSSQDSNPSRPPPVVG